MKIKLVHILIIIVIFFLILFKLKSQKNIEPLRSFTGPRNHFVSLGRPLWIK